MSDTTYKTTYDITGVSNCFFFWGCKSLWNIGSCQQAVYTHCITSRAFSVQAFFKVQVQKWEKVRPTFFQQKPGKFPLKPHLNPFKQCDMNCQHSKGNITPIALKTSIWFQFKPCHHWSNMSLLQFTHSFLNLFMYMSKCFNGPPGWRMNQWFFHKQPCTHKLFHFFPSFCHDLHISLVPPISPLWNRNHLQGMHASNQVKIFQGHLKTIRFFPL